MALEENFEDLEEVLQTAPFPQLQNPGWATVPGPKGGTGLADIATVVGLKG